MKSAAVVILMLSVLAVGCVGKGTGPDSEKSASLKSLLDAATSTVDSMRSDPLFDQALAKAKGILVFPHTYKAGWVFGVEGGSGVMLARDQFGYWGPPAFYDFGGLGFGIQAGIRRASLVFMFMDSYWLEDSLEDGLFMDADVEVVALNYSADARSNTLTGDNPVLLFMDAAGLYAGASFGGTRIGVNESANAAFCGGENATATDIVLGWECENSLADELRKSLGVSDPVIAIDKP